MPRWSDFSLGMSTLGIGFILDLFYDRPVVHVQRQIPNVTENWC